MASEILAVPEDDLAEVIATIRAGLRHRFGLARKSRQQARVCRELHRWCDEEEGYLARLTSDD